MKLAVCNDGEIGVRYEEGEQVEICFAITALALRMAGAACMSDKQAYNETLRGVHKDFFLCKMAC
jgi:hypothetical protein